jgi:hypothetical protein
MSRFLYCCLLIAVLWLTGCSSSPQTPPPQAAPLKPVTLDNTVKIIAGQTIYVPIYSQIYMWDQSRTMDLTATLSVRNTDLAQPLIIASVNYYDTNGKLVRNYLERPGELTPLATTSFVIQQEDNSGGPGAAFVVEWVAQQPVTPPVIEAIMINTSGNQGVSFISAGRVIKSRDGK